MTGDILRLLDACEAARADADRLRLHTGGSGAAVGVHGAATAAEEAATDACTKALMRLEPALQYDTARAMVAIPAYRAKVRAIYTAKGGAGT